MLGLPLDSSDSDEYRAWRTGGVRLSLDRFERFGPDVGLTLSNGAAVNPPYAARSASNGVALISDQTAHSTSK